MLGPEFQVNSYTTDDQFAPAVAMAASGEFVVVWDSHYQDGSAFGVFGQRFDSAGLPLGNEFQVNAVAAGPQLSPAVAVGGGGGFVVVWHDWWGDGSYGGVFGRRFDAEGLPAGDDFQVNTYTTYDQIEAAVVADSSGNFVVVWQSYQDGDGWGVFGQRFDSAGLPVGGELPINSYTTMHQQYPEVATGGAGNFIVVWQSSQDGSGSSVHGQRFDAAGLPVGNEFQVNSSTSGFQGLPAVAAGDAGNFVVVWSSPDGSGSGVFGQRFDAAGLPTGGEFQVNSYTTGYQDYPAVASGGSGGFVVAWTSGGQDGPDWGVFAQRFDAAGLPVGPEFQVNSYTTDHQRAPTVAAVNSGTFVVAWQSLGQDGSYNGVFARRATAAPVFTDGFEAGDTCAWSLSVGGGCP